MIAYAASHGHCIVCSQYTHVRLILTNVPRLVFRSFIMGLIDSTKDVNEVGSRLVNGINNVNDVEATTQ